jgi:hypothetical protein
MEAEGLQARRKQLSGLYYDIEHSTDQTKRQELSTEYNKLYDELGIMYELVLRRCLGLTPEEVENLNVLEFTDLAHELIDYSLRQ